MLVSSPLPVTAWAKNPNRTLAAFAADGTLVAERVSSLDS
jgi:hypothetical protein